MPTHTVKIIICPTRLQDGGECNDYLSDERCPDCPVKPEEANDFVKEVI